MEYVYSLRPLIHRHRFISHTDVDSEPLNPALDTKKALFDARPLVAGGGLEPPTSGL